MQEPLSLWQRAVAHLRDPTGYSQEHPQFWQAYKSLHKTGENYPSGPKMTIDSYIKSSTIVALASVKRLIKPLRSLLSWSMAFNNVLRSRILSIDIHRWSSEQAWIQVQVVIGLLLQL
jgi:hypothetical protein